MKKILKKRRKQHKTDYLHRLKLLKSGKPRVVFRKTNKYLIAQYVTSKEAQDKVILNITSRNLIKYGWPEQSIGSLKSIPASYLTGLMMGKQIQEKKLDTPIIDFGMLRTTHKTKIFAFIKGIIDAGIKIKCDEAAFPEETRIKGEHTKSKIPFNEIKSKLTGEK